MKRLNGAGTRALEIVKQFTVAQRTIAIIGVAVVVLGAVALVNWLGKPTMEPLYSNISTTDAAAVKAQLDKDKVEYQLSDGGTTILVPAASVDAEKLATASLLSSGAGGYTLLDNLGVTASEFQQNVTYKRAIEGELAKTIESINGVAAASVQLAIPQQTVFSDQEEDPTASVFVNVGTSLTSDQVNAIVHLVAAAYPGLTTDNVSVVDQKGDTLSAVGGVAGGTDTAGDYESATKSAVQAMLDKVLGPGNAVVTVAADVSNSSGTKKSTTYTQGSTTPLSESSSSTSNGSGTGAGSTNGVSGVLGNDTTDTSTGGNSSTSGTTSGTGGDSGYTTEQSVKNNAVNSTETNETIVPGTLNRQTISVAVNSSKVSSISTGTLQRMVETAAGVDTTRGDTVSVSAVPFSNAAAKSAAAALKQSEAAAGSDQMTEIITTAIKVVGGLVLFVLVVGLLRKLFKRQEPTAVEGGAMQVVPTMPGDGGYPGYAPTAQLGAFGAPGQLSGGPGTAPTVAFGDPVGHDGAFAAMQADVDALAGSNPEQTADLLRALMSDGART